MVVRRVTLPGADELFRSTGPQAVLPGEGTATPADSRGARERLHAVPSVGVRRSSPRQRHDTKITVYLSAAELLDLEQARLTLRRAHGIAVDRGRIVREAVAAALEELDAAGPQSALVRRLTPH